MSAISGEPKALDIGSYMTIRKYITHLKTSRWSRKGDSAIMIEHGEGSSAKLIKELQSVWSPFCLQGNIDVMSGGRKIPDVKFFKNSSLLELDIKELLASAKQSPFGHGTETVTDTSVRNSFEIDASKFLAGKADLIAQNHIVISSMAPGQDLKLRPYKLVIYKKGGHFEEHRDTVRGEGHIGTLVVILNSAYTGGELEVSHNGHTESVTGAYSWVAMYGDCLHKIKPVKSGTRVSLIYDIYSESAHHEETGDEEEGEEEEEADFEEEGDEEFWATKHELEPTEAVHLVDSNAKKNILKEVNKELHGVDNLIITLQHLYPECQTSPAFLKGGDRALYDLLSEQYDVTVVAATIFRTYEATNNESELFCEMFSPSLVAQALLKGPYQRETPNSTKKKASTTKVVICDHLLKASVLDYTPYNEYTGNESQEEETVYIVAGLQVATKKVAKVVKKAASTTAKAVPKAATKAATKTVIKKATKSVTKAAIKKAPKAVTKKA